MSKRSLQLISGFLLAFTLLINPAFAQGAPAQWNYSFQNNNAQALYPGQVAIPQLGTQSCLGTVSGLITAGTCGGGSTVSSKAAMAALPTANGSIVYLSAGNASGLWQFTTVNRSTYVTNDPDQGANVAPTSDPTGASGAWVNTNSTLSQYDFGAVCNSSTDDAAKIQAVFNYSAFSGIPFKFKPGTCVIGSTVIDAADGDMSQAEFEANGKSSAFASYPSSVLVIGTTTSGGVVDNVNVTLPTMLDTSHTPGNDWSGQVAYGVSLINLNWSQVNASSINGFFGNMRLGGFGEGTAYNTVNLQNLTNGHDNLTFGAFNLAGWSNQNTIVGGKISNDSDETNISGTHGILMEISGASGNQADGNTIVGTALEGPVAVSLEYSGALDNTLVGVRFENNTPLLFCSGGNNYGNYILGGYKENLTYSSCSSTDQIGMLDHNGDYFPQALILGTAGSTTAPQILEGSGTPATGLGTIGSIYLNTAGGATTTLYVKTGSATWTAK